MISIKRARDESRIRDKKRNRFILSIGALKWHISAKEALHLKTQLRKLNLIK